MELIRPPRRVGAYPVRSGTRRVSARVMNELCVFGWALFGEGREVREDQGGWLMRTKAEDVDEGGVAAGFSALDNLLVSYWWISM
jgi:glutathione synthase